MSGFAGAVALSREGLRMGVVVVVGVEDGMIWGS